MISFAESDRDLEEARAIFREYAASLDFSLAYQGFEEELAGLPGRYARPGGCILLARQGDAVAACVAMRPLPTGERGGNICEMKRLFVRPGFRGRGLGRRLCERLIDEARRAGYAAMWLDTESTMIPAVTLYRSLGFREIPRYNDDPMPETIYLGLELGSRQQQAGPTGLGSGAPRSDHRRVAGRQPPEARRADDAAQHGGGHPRA